MRTAIGYARVSTVEQAAEGVSLDAQEARIRAWVGTHVAGLARVYVDAGISGKRQDNRPGLQEALDAVCLAKGVLVVYSLSRLARSTRDAIEIAERLAKAGADLVSLTEDLNTTTASGKLLFRLLAVLAEFERDLVAERTRTALAHKRSKGERIGQVPYGFRLADDGVSLSPDVREQAVIRMVAAFSSEGKSLRWIARMITRMGFSTKNRGAEWSPSSIAAIVKRTPKQPPTPRADAPAKHTLSYQLKEIVEARGLTAYALGRLAEVDPGVVSRWMTGKRDVRLDTADRLAAALGLRLVEVGGRARGR